MNQEQIRCQKHFPAISGFISCSRRDTRPRISYRSRCSNSSLTDPRFSEGNKNACDISLRIAAPVYLHIAIYFGLFFESLGSTAQKCVSFSSATCTRTQHCDFFAFALQLEIICVLLFLLQPEVPEDTNSANLY